MKFLIFSLIYINFCFATEAIQEFEKFVTLDKDFKSLVEQKAVRWDKESKYLTKVILIDIDKDFNYRGIEFKNGFRLAWRYDDKKKQGYFDRIIFSGNISVKGAKWRPASNKGKLPSTGSLYLHPSQSHFIPKSGFLAEDFQLEDKKYLANRYICLDINMKIVKYIEYDFSKIERVNLDDCGINFFGLTDELMIEGVNFLPRTDVFFDKDGKWEFIRMRPGQEFLGKVYKDGGVLLRGEYNKYQKNHGPEDIRILTPDMEGYPH